MLIKVEDLMYDGYLNAPFRFDKEQESLTVIMPSYSFGKVLGCLLAWTVC